MGRKSFIYPCCSLILLIFSAGQAIANSSGGSIPSNRGSTQETGGVQSSVHDCTETLSKFNPFHVDINAFITAELQGVFARNAELKMRLKAIGQRLHKTGWKLSEKEVQLVAYRATMLEKMLDKYVPTDSELNREIRRGVDRCIGFDWAAGTSWHKAILNRKSRNLAPAECKRLKTFIKTRERIKIAEEQNAEALSVDFDESPWIKKLGTTEVGVGADFSCAILDQAIALTLQDSVQGLQSKPVDPSHEAVVADIERYINSEMKKPSLEMCGVRWPLQEEEMTISKVINDRHYIRKYYTELKKQEDLAIQDKTKRLKANGLKFLVEELTVTPEEAKSELEKFKKSFVDDMLLEFDSLDYIRSILDPTKPEDTEILKILQEEYKH